MVEQIACRWRERGVAMGGAPMRYGLLERVRECCARQGVELLAFGFAADELRLVCDGEAGAVGNVVRGMKVGTGCAARARGVALDWAPAVRDPVPEGGLADAVAWAHRAPVEAGAAGPLASPWSSHRDLLGFRRASFYDAAPLARRLCGREVHRAAGGGRLPGGQPRLRADPEPIPLLLRVAAAVQGLLPADPRCFGLFTGLARARGWQTIDIARALCLTTRRVRQLAARDEPLLPVAVRALGDPRLRRVP